ncbi:MAG TPA: metal ABC transporter permease [Desulfobacterales bacterium]|nr:metal ABC transporter permease [Desulfobacterales bacterium]
MSEILGLGFMHNALLAGLLVSLVCGMLSVFIVLRRMAFVGAGISHSAFGGVALGFLLHVDPFWTGLIFAILVAFLIEWVQSRGKIEEDTAIGIFFAAAMALGVVFLHLSRTYNVDVFGVLFGNILSVGRTQLHQVAGVAAVVLFFIWFFFKELVFISFDEEMAWVCGAPVKALRYLFLAALALVIIASIYLVGIVLVSALLVIPAAVARNLTTQIRSMILVSTGTAIGSTLGGLGFSYLIDLPSGATIVILLAGLFLLTTAWSRYRLTGTG